MGGTEGIGSYVGGAGRGTPILDQGGLGRALALASMRVMLGASLLHLPFGSTPRTTKRHVLYCENSGCIFSLFLHASCKATPMLGPSP